MKKLQYIFIFTSKKFHCMTTKYASSLFTTYRVTTVSRNIKSNEEIEREDPPLFLETIEVSMLETEWPFF